MALEAVAQALPTGKPPFEIIVVDRSQNHSPEYLAINPFGTVPALVTDDGGLMLESFAVLLHIAARFPEARLAPPVASKLRDRAHTLLSVMVTVGQPAFQMLWRSERFADTHEGRAAVQRMCQVRLAALFERLENEIGPSGYLSDAGPNIADMYLYVLARWGFRLDRSTKNYPRLWALARNMADLPFVYRAMQREGIALEEPSSGPG
jgi:glutathione S-transferase